MLVPFEERSLSGFVKVAVNGENRNESPDMIGNTSSDCISFLCFFC